MGKFEGFPLPKENWSKLPHDLIGALPRFTSRAELAVVLYVLRHTWGYQEFEEPKRITLDEFENGRKRGDGTRIDRGVGMSKPSIVNGLSRAEEHGFLESITDDTDKGRVKKYYRLRMQVLNSLTSEVKDFSSKGQESLQRTEKDTLERNERKNHTQLKLRTIRAKTWRGNPYPVPAGTQFADADWQRARVAVAQALRMTEQQHFAVTGVVTDYLCWKFSDGQVASGAHLFDIGAVHMAIDWFVRVWLAHDVPGGEMPTPWNVVDWYERAKDWPDPLEAQTVGKVQERESRVE